MTSRDDHVVETANSERLMTLAGSTDKRQIWLEDSFHVATLDYERFEIEARAVEFAVKVTADS